MGKAQLDMFGENQPELFLAAPAVVHPDPERIRLRLGRILGEARAAAAMPWDDNRRRLYEELVPQMSGSLPAAEAAQIVAEFGRELIRLDAAAIAAE
jgi:hypothetical protein